jgi:hypothetical protein
MTPGSRIHLCFVRIGVCLVAIVLGAVIIGCDGAGGDLILTIASTEGGSVTDPGEGIFTYDEATVVNLVATPDAGYGLAEWTGDVDDIADVEDATTTITMNGNYSITAEFVKQLVKQYDLTITSTAGGNVTDPGEGTFTYDEGTVVNLVAVADEGYHFQLGGWVGNVDTIDNVDDPATTITMNDNYSITAQFAQSGQVIRIGLARDLDLSYFECSGAGPVYRWFVDKVNADGGIYLSELDDTLPVELVVRDFDTTTWNLGAVTQALIETYDCDFIWGGPGTDCIYTQAPVCNAHGVLLITLEGGTSNMIWEGDIDTWPYVWVNSSFANWNQIPVLYDTLNAELDHDPVAYITCVGGIGAALGLEYRDETRAVFGNENVIDAGLHPFVVDALVADTIIANAKTALGSDPYDIFCAFTYPWNVAALTQACIDNDFNPPAILFGLGANYNEYPVTFGSSADGIMSFIVADNHTSPAVSNMYAELAAQIEVAWDDPCLPCQQGLLVTGWDRLDYWGMPCYVAGLQLWKDAVEQAGNLSSVAVRSALASLNTTTVLGTNTWYTVFGGGLGGGILAYETHPGEIGQWLSGEFRTVGGNDPTASFAYPMTDSWSWLP